MSASVLMLAASLSACASFPALTTKPSKPVPVDTVAAAEAKAKVDAANELQGGAADYLTIPDANPVPLHPGAPPATAEQIAALVPETPIDASLPPQALPQFCDTVFGDLLHLPYTLGPEVGRRPDIVTVRSAPHMSRRAFFALVQSALEQYGLTVSIVGGSVNVHEGAGGGASQVIRGRSSRETPTGSRNIVQFVQLYTLEANNLQPLLNDLFPNTRSAKITPLVASNSLIVTGPAREVAGAVDTITQLDQPRFAGARVARLQPAFFSAEQFATALTNALTVEGYTVSNAPNIPRGLMILPLPATNQVLAFAGDEKVMSRVQFWAAELDKPSQVGSQSSTFVYVVRNTDATSLGALTRGEQPQTFTPTNPVGVPGTSSLSSTTGQISQTPATASTQARFQNNSSTSGTVATGGRITVDPVGNRILFTGTATEFAQLRSLMEQLDVPPRQVMVEVTVAEVTLTDQTSLGLEWFFSNSGTTLAATQPFSGGTLGGLGIGSSGLVLNYATSMIPGLSNLQAQFNAFASNNKVNILSRPRIVAKSGGDAQIQVGTDIPIITSQAASTLQTGGTSDVLQTVSYRQTGVILKIKPTVYGDRVDLEISQEVSDQSGAANGSISSPTISDRTISTELSLQDGATAVLGGLISNNYSKSNNGLPFLKDIPIIGTAFRSDSVNGTKDELVILVTPHVIHDTEEMSAIAGDLSRSINQAFKTGRGWSYTLSPFATGANLGIGVPSATTTPSHIGLALSRVRERQAEIAAETQLEEPNPALVTPTPGTPTPASPGPVRRPAAPGSGAIPPGRN